MKIRTRALVGSCRAADGESSPCSRRRQPGPPQTRTRGAAAGDIGPGPPARPAAARFQPGRAADDAESAGPQERLPRHPPVHALARPRRFWRPASATSSASIPARRSGSSSATGCCPARKSACTGRAIARSRSSGSRTCCSRRRTDLRSVSTSSRRSRGPTTSAGNIVRPSASRSRGSSADSPRIYAEPIFVVNSEPVRRGREQHADDRAWRPRAHPAVALHRRRSDAACQRLHARASSRPASGIEMRSGGHAFQINVSNGFGTTLGQLARGGVNSDSWFIGFNIARKFF